VARDPARHAYWYPDLAGTVLLYLNTRTKPFDDKEVRKAVSMAIDRARIVAEAISGYAPPADATGLADSQKRWKDPEAQGAAWAKHDPARANAALDRAGLSRGADGIRVVPGGTPMRYEIHTIAGWSDWHAAAGIIQRSLAEVGVAASLSPVPYQSWMEKLQTGRFDMGLWYAPRGPTPYQFYRSQMDPALVRPVGQGGGENFHRFGSRAAGTILRRFEASSHAPELLTLSHQLQRVYVEDAPSIPLYASPAWGVFNTRYYSGFPSRLRPYAAPAPGVPDGLPALLEVAAR
jgi:peptide/nickel transport system substrate-binding protein